MLVLKLLCARYFIQVICIQIHKIWWFFAFSYSFMYLLFPDAYRCAAWHMNSLIPFSSINKISISVNNYNSSSVFFKHFCYANRGADKKWSRSSSYISIHLLQKLSNTSAIDNVSFWTYKSWYSTRFFVSKFFHTFSHAYNKQF